MLTKRQLRARHGQPLMKQNLRIAVRMWLDGFDTVDIAQRLGISEASVCRDMSAIRVLVNDYRTKWAVA